MVLEVPGRRVGRGDGDGLVFRGGYAREGLDVCGVEEDGVGVRVAALG